MASIKMQVLLFFGRPYKFTNKENGEVLEGVKIQYYPDDNLNPIFDKESGVYGNQIMSDTVPYSVLSSIKSVPGIYECSCSMTNAKAENGSLIPRLKVNDLKFVSDFLISKESKK